MKEKQVIRTSWSTGKRKHLFYHCRDAAARKVEYVPPLHGNSILLRLFGKAVSKASSLDDEIPGASPVRVHQIMCELGLVGSCFQSRSGAGVSKQQRCGSIVGIHKLG